MKYGLLLFGVSEALSVSAAILVHAMNVLPVMIVGLAFAWIERVSWKDLVSASRQIKGLGADATPVADQRPVEESP
jgi:hypothetical protein